MSPLSCRMASKVYSSRHRHCSSRRAHGSTPPRTSGWAPFRRAGNGHSRATSLQRCPMRRDHLVGLLWTGDIGLAVPQVIAVERQEAEARDVHLGAGVFVELEREADVDRSGSSVVPLMPVLVPPLASIQLRGSRCRSTCIRSRPARRCPAERPRRAPSGWLPAGMNQWPSGACCGTVSGDGGTASTGGGCATGVVRHRSLRGSRKGKRADQQYNEDQEEEGVRFHRVAPLLMRRNDRLRFVCGY